LAPFATFRNAGCIEITTSGATHGFSPLLGTDESINTQFKAGAESYKRHFGRAPKGVWLPECAYRPEEKQVTPSGQVVVRPSIDAFLYENDLKHFYTEFTRLRVASLPVPAALSGFTATSNIFRCPFVQPRACRRLKPTG